ncbi:MAG TPA: SURF1 family protein, partial [Acidimicrobiales bacterium]
EVRNRSQDGAPGAWLVTPVVLDGGARVGVVRGFVGFRADGSLATVDPPGGTVTVTGLSLDPHRLGGTAGRDLDPLLAEDDVLPAVVLASASDPPEPAGVEAGGEPAEPGRAVIVAVPPPELSEGPHLSYAVQWFTFSAIAVVGYPLVLRRVVARRGKEVDDAGEADRPGRHDDLDRELEEILREGR